MVTRTFTFEGKRYYIRGKDEVEAEVKKALKLKELEDGKNLVSNNMPLRKWAEICVDTYKTNQKEITRKKYVNRMRHCILEDLGDMPLKKITPMMCQRVMNKQTGNSKSQINQVYQMMNFLFDRAVENKYIVENPAKNVQRPTGTKTHRRSLTEREYNRAIEVAYLDERFNIWLLMVLCGCRPSEAMEVQGHDIKIVEGYPMLHIRGTKTGNADRTVPMPLELYEHLKHVEPFEYVCKDTRGNKMTDNSKRRCWNAFKKLMDDAPLKVVGDDLTPYCLRHTYCSNLQKQGVDIRTAQYLMGHSDISLTANIYTHADQTTILTAAEKINSDTRILAT